MNLKYLLVCLIGILFFFNPRRALCQIKWLIDQQRYKEARILISRLRWLRPFPDYEKLRRLLSILETARKGHISEAIAQLQTYPENDYQTRILSYVIKADWENCLLWIEANIPPSMLWANPDLLLYYLRALGETGRLNELLQVFTNNHRRLQKDSVSNQYNTARLYVLVFCGQILQVKQLLNNFFSFYPQSLQKFWFSTAQLIAGKKYVARHQLLELRLDKDYILGNAIDWRLCYPPIDPTSVLDARSFGILQRLTTEINQELRFHPAHSNKAKIPYITVLFFLINSGVFAWEIWLGGTQQDVVLYNLGALVPQAVFSGQWWRLLTANFLHYGWLHFGTNMLGLLFVGQVAEAILGRIFFSILYLFSGTGALLIFTLLARRNQLLDAMLVGASAAIMGLVGGILAYYLWDWLRTKSASAFQRMSFIVLICALQFFTDYYTPGVSLSSHAWGLFLGFILTFSRFFYLRGVKTFF
ncbi:MAG: hypothetical protein N5P05_000815 [Chroococcopsis gigantea SAG 12.99]|jgi:rhomboid protease GluP|nr:rhomboid family intramembrane serine protease [Chlorogloea purpurea SAG 13.99]MDV2999209.1 hypothetical protein [Chroococcopsis gigantea SAG 12.99]